MRRTALVLLACCTMLLLAGCDPAPVAVSIGDNFFDPPSATAPRGGTVRWTNNGFVRHTTTGNAPLNLWSASVNPGAQADQKFVAGGSYAYHCTIHFGMAGTVNVPIAVSPASGSTATTFTVTLASQAAPSGFEYVVQKKDPGGSFAAFRTVTTASTTFKPTSGGSYQFRAALKRTTSSAASGFSAAQTISVS
jgi:plastocyanin